MKHFNLIIALVLCSFLTTNAQPTNGLIAHWDFNGNTNDVYGTHNGTPYGISPATGKAGLPNTAYYFSDTVSYVDVPYQPDMNVTSFSISAVVKASSIYTGLCQANFILTRGNDFTPGNYGLSFGDNAYNDCYTVDTTKFVFYPFAYNPPPNTSQYQYSPTIATNKWYCVTVTYSTSAAKVYIDGALKATNYPAGSIGSSLSGITIGRHPNSFLYPYQFNGYIDDIMLYNRVLSDSEINSYCNSFSGDNPIDTNDHNDTGLYVQTITNPQINLYPNPSKGNFKIAGIVNTNAEGHIFIMNAIGQIVYKETVLPANNYFEKEINLSGDLPQGVYIIRYTSGDYNWSSKMLIRK